jgi:hypothetical protein
VEGMIRWHHRVIIYAWVLVTDRYPPFRLIKLSRVAAHPGQLTACPASAITASVRAPALAITDDASPFALRSTRNRLSSRCWPSAACWSSWSGR